MKYKHTNTGREPMGFCDSKGNHHALLPGKDIILDEECKFNYLQVEEIVEKKTRKISKILEEE